MEEDMILIGGQPESEIEYDNFYLTVINHQIDTLYSLEPLDYRELYDAYQEAKIKCVSKCFEVIAAAQNALLNEIRVPPKKDKR